LLFPNKLPSADLANVSKREPSPLRNDERVAQSMSPPVNERVPNQNESAPATLAEPGEGGWVGRNQRGNQQMDDKPSNWEQRAQLKPHRAPPARAGRRRHKAHLHRPPIAVHLLDHCFPPCAAVLTARPRRPHLFRAKHMSANAVGRRQLCRLWRPSRRRRLRLRFALRAAPLKGQHKYRTY
jgi:hypothetical protein